MTRKWNSKLGETTSAPMQKAEKWYTQAIAAGIPLPEAVCLSTSTKREDGEVGVSSRMVLMRGYSEEGFIFFSNTESRKGQSIAENPYVALNFHWQSLEYQIQVEGLAVPVPEQLADAYFDSRPLGSRVSAIVSPQSRTVESYSALKEEQNKLFEKAKTSTDVINRPSHWGGWLVQPTRMEFWEGKKDRLHFRELWIKSNDEWTSTLLAP